MQKRFIQALRFRGWRQLSLMFALWSLATIATGCFLDAAPKAETWQELLSAVGLGAALAFGALGALVTLVREWN